MLKRFLINIFLIFPGVAIAADPVFTFAPPPVAYDGASGSKRYTFLSADFGTETFTGLGYASSKTIDPSSIGSGASSIDDSEGLFLLTSETATMFASDFGFRRENQLSSSGGSIFFHGYNHGINIMEIDTSTVTSDGKFSQVMFPFSYTIGFQQKIALGDSVILTPYFYSVAGVTFTAHTSISCPVGPGFCATGDGQDQFDYTATIFGFDIFIGGTSISAMLTDSENDMIMFSVGFPIR